MMPADPHRHLDDETLNAVLDGEAPEEERADAAACPDCSARLVRLGSVATALGAPVHPSDGQRRRAAIDAALRAQDSDVAAPMPLRLRRRWRVSPGWAAAAAVVLAGALAVPLVDDLGRSDGGQDAATAGDTEDETSAGRSAADEEAPQSDGRLAPARGGAQPHLGEIDLDNLNALAASIDRGLAAPGAAEYAAAEQPCEESARQRDPSLQRLAYAGEGTVGGRPATLLAFEVASSGTPPTVRLLVLATDNCAELGSSST